MATARFSNKKNTIKKFKILKKRGNQKLLAATKRYARYSECARIPGIQRLFTAARNTFVVVKIQKFPDSRGYSMQ